MMQDIRCALADMAHNVREAREKIKKAHHWRERNRAIADWQRDMAKGHLDYNTKINDATAKMMSESAAKHAGDHHALGMLDAYKEWLADITDDTVEVMAMLSAYK